MTTSTSRHNLLYNFPKSTTQSQHSKNSQHPHKLGPTIPRRPSTSRKLRNTTGSRSTGPTDTSPGRHRRSIPSTNRLRLHNRPIIRVRRTRSHGIQRAPRGLADAIQRRALCGDYDRRRTAPVSEQLPQRLGNGRDVLDRHAKRRRREADLLDEVAEFMRIERHERVRRRHVAPFVRGEPGRRVCGTAEQRAEELIQVREEFVLVRVFAVGGEVFLQGLRAAVVEEVDGDGLAFAVCGF